MSEVYRLDDLPKGIYVQSGRAQGRTKPHYPSHGIDPFKTWRFAHGGGVSLATWLSRGQSATVGRDGIKGKASAIKRYSKHSVHATPSRNGRTFPPR